MPNLPPEPDVPPCGAWPMFGGCTLPAGHNMGKVDVPSAHRLLLQPPVTQPRRVRVIRVLEYDYPDQETAERDMARWGVPPNGTRNGWGGQSQIHRVTGERRAGVVIRSATTFPQTMPHEEPASDDRKPPKTDFPNELSKELAAVAELTYEQQVAADLADTPEQPAVKAVCRAIVDRQGRRESCGYTLGTLGEWNTCSNASNHLGVDEGDETDEEDHPYDYDPFE